MRLPSTTARCSLDVLLHQTISICSRISYLCCRTVQVLCEGMFDVATLPTTSARCSLDRLHWTPISGIYVFTILMFVLPHIAGAVLGHVQCGCHPQLLYNDNVTLDVLDLYMSHVCLSAYYRCCVKACTMCLQSTAAVARRPSSCLWACTKTSKMIKR
jgi:hypothetical protein